MSNYFDEIFESPIEIKNTSSGRGVFATRDIKKGENIFNLEIDQIITDKLVKNSDIGIKI